MSTVRMLCWTAREAAEKMLANIETLRNEELEKVIAWRMRTDFWSRFFYFVWWLKFAPRTREEAIESMKQDSSFISTYERITTWLYRRSYGLAKDVIRLCKVSADGFVTLDHEHIEALYGEL